MSPLLDDVLEGSNVFRGYKWHLLLNLKQLQVCLSPFSKRHFPKMIRPKATMKGNVEVLGRRIALKI